MVGHSLLLSRDRWSSWRVHGGPHRRFSKAVFSPHRYPRTISRHPAGFPPDRGPYSTRQLEDIYNYKISLFFVSARAVRATPTQTKLMPAASTCLPTTSVQSSRATRPQMHPALRPLHLARHRMSPCSGALSCKMKPARSPDTPSTNSIHRDCQSERKIVPPAERAHRHLNDPRTSTTRYRRK